MKPCFLTWVVGVGVLWGALGFGGSAAHADDGAVRVRVRKSVSSLTISGFGLRGLESSDELRAPASPLPRFQKLRVARTTSGWRVFTEGQTDGQTEAQPERVVRAAGELSVTGSLLKIDGVAVADTLAFQPVDGGFDVVARVPMQDYLKGVVPSEMPIRWPIEALKAQVVAARSYSLSLMTERKSQPFDVDDSVLHQVFRPKNFSGASAADQEKILSAIAQTQGHHLADLNGQVMRSFFHADCGGRTEEPHAVWGGESVIGTTVDKGCEMSSRNQWAFGISQVELTKILARHLRLASGEWRVVALDTSRRTLSDRTEWIHVRFQKTSSEKPRHLGEERVMPLSGQELRRLVGFDRIKSTKMSVELSDGRFTFKGRGHGHGVGMCQTGARLMALGGADYRAILNRYYPNAKLTASQLLPR